MSCTRESVSQVATSEGHREGNSGANACEKHIERRPRTLRGVRVVPSSFSVCVLCAVHQLHMFRHELVNVYKRPSAAYIYIYIYALMTLYKRDIRAE